MPSGSGGIISVGDYDTSLGQGGGNTGGGTGGNTGGGNTGPGYTADPPTYPGGAAAVSSGPRGIEATWEYRDLKMNVRDWVETYLITTINGIDDADVRDNRDPNPGYHGETPFKSLYGGRTIVLQGKIVARTIWRLTDMRRALKQAFGDISREYPLFIRTNAAEKDVFIMCKKTSPIQVTDMQNTLNGFERAFQITLRASNPRFLSYVEQFKTFSIPNSTFNGVVFICTNDGNFEGAQPKFRIHGPLNAPSNGARAMTILNEATGQRIFIKAPPGTTAVIPSGHFLEIDIARRSMKQYQTSTTTVVGNRFQLLEVGSAWMEFMPGDNPISVSSASGSGQRDFQVWWRHSHL